MGQATLDQVIYPTEIETLKLIPSSVDLTGAEIELVGMENREKRLQAVLESVQDDYEFILIDCPPSLGLLTLNALAVCQSVLIPNDGGLGITLSEDDLGLYDLLMGQATLDQVTYPTEIETLKLIPSSVDLTGAEIELVSMENREKRLQAVLESAQDDYEFILIDCPPSLGLLTLNALAVCQSVLIPMQCEYYALQGLSHLLKTLKLVKRSLNPDLRVEGILLTMFDGRTLLAGQVRDQVKKYFKEFLIETIIPRNVRLSEAPSHGKPVVLYAGRSRGADAYIELAKEIIARSRNENLETTPIGESVA